MIKVRHVFVIGSKGIPAKYGGFETFVEKLTEYQINNKIQYHVACISNNNETFKFNNANCFNIKVPNIGSAKAVYYDYVAFKRCIDYIKKFKIERPIIYVLACRIGPFIPYLKFHLKKFEGILYVNPDGHEWERAKWNKVIKKYWKMSERYMMKYADLVICDSKVIRKYIKKQYMKYNPKTIFIAYGAEGLKVKLLNNDKDTKCISGWYKETHIKKGDYFLSVGRFVPENNYEIMIKEFMKSNTKKDLVFITNVERNKFYNRLKLNTGFDKDKRIKFVGTIYNEEMLSNIRENAYAYIHGHEVGGTNPSLLEALACTDLNLLLDVEFNREVGESSVIYWDKEKGNLSKVIDQVDCMSKNEKLKIGVLAKERVKKNYDWKYIVGEYEKIFRGDL